MPIQGSCNLPAMCLQARGLKFFKNCHSVELNKIVETTMSVNLYDDLTAEAARKG